MKLLKITKTISNDDKEKLLEIYEESNKENIAYFYPDDDYEVATKKLYHDYGSFIDEYLLNNTIYVLEDNNKWVSALRIAFHNDFFWLEALETRVDNRNKGYGTKLIEETIKDLSINHKDIKSAVSKKNIVSLRVHEKCGFKIFEENAYDYSNNPPTLEESEYGLIYKY